MYGNYTAGKNKYKDSTAISVNGENVYLLQVATRCQVQARIEVTLVLLGLSLLATHIAICRPHFKASFYCKNSFQA